MKVYRIVKYASLAVVLLAIGLIASLPFRFPDSTIAWKWALLFSLPAIMLVGLLFLKAHCEIRTFRFLLLAALLLSAIATIVGSMALLVFVVFLVALAALYPSYTLKTVKIFNNKA